MSKITEIADESPGQSLFRAPDDLIAEIESRPAGRLSLDTHFLRTPRPGTYVLFVEKIGCTFLKQLLIEALYGDITALDPDYFHAGWTHRNLVHAFSADVLTIDGRAALRDPASTIITFCRNPYDRFVSAYTNRITRLEPAELPLFYWHRRSILFDAARRGVPGAGFDRFRAGITLREFADFVRHTPPGLRDVHWAAQHTLNLADIVAPAALVRFEDFERQLLDAWTAHIGPAPPATASIERNRSGKVPGLLDEDTAGIVYEVYRHDFDLFGYDKDSWRDF